jgi:hypothetical protein
VDASREAVPIIPALVLKYFRPHNPSKIKLASGNNGISAM